MKHAAPAKRSFEARLTARGPGGAWTFLPIPFDVQAVFGSKARVAVRGARRVAAGPRRRSGRCRGLRVAVTVSPQRVRRLGREWQEGGNPAESRREGGAHGARPQARALILQSRGDGIRELPDRPGHCRDQHLVVDFVDFGCRDLEHTLADG